MDVSRSVACGAWGCRPRWLQRFATPRGFLWVYGLLGTTQTMAYLYFVATLTTMERRFKIPSKTTGLMLSGNEISQILLSLLLTYFGGRGNRPRWIAWGVAISALSCFILALPHLLYGPGSEALALTKEHISGSIQHEAPAWEVTNASFSAIVGRRAVSLCGAKQKTADENDSACDAAHDADTQDGNYSMVPILLVFLSQFVLGIGTTLYYALGQIYLDDNTRKTNTPLLLGMTMALRTLGPVLGFTLGFACLSLYVDPTLTPVITKKDPRWIGAWWLGWLLLGCAMLLFAALIALFPRRLPTPPPKKPILKQAGKSAADTLLPQPVEVAKPTLKEFPAALRRLLSNDILMYNIMSSVFYILGASGYITFSIKYMEVQYNESAAGASVFAGIGGLCAMVLGFLISGYVISKFRPRPRVLLFWNVIAGSFYVIAEIIFIFIGCPDMPLHGTNVTGGPLQLITDCNSGCGCPSDTRFSPVCIGNVTFFSPCHAGCSKQFNISQLGQNRTFSDCQCAQEAMFVSNSTGSDFSFSTLVAKEGACLPDCGYMILWFIALTCTMHMIGSSAKIGNILVNFRCVEPQDKAFAQGLALGLISLLAFIPGPILFGGIIDASCLIWDSSCGRKGHCALYHKANFRLYMNITAASVTTIAILLDLVVWYKGKNLDLYGDNDGKKEKARNRKGIN